MRQILVGLFPIFVVILNSLALTFGVSELSYGQAERHAVKKTFSIMAQPLSSALLDFGAQANLSLLVRKADTEGLTVKKLTGSFYPRDALNILLADTKLGFDYIDSSTISISPDLFRPAPPKPARQTADQDITTDETLNEDQMATLDEVIVTSLRRRSNMQKVPVAVSVIKPPLIREARIHDIEDVGTRIPGLTVSSFSIGQPTIHMRGVGSNDDGAALDNSIVLFIDDVYVGRITSINMSFFDLEQIEIIRGPQGTLYGKNAIGGAINVTSNNPTDHLTGEVEATLGNYNRFDLRANISGPLIEDKLLGRLAFHSRKRDGWQKSLFLPGIKQNDENTWAARGKLLLAVNDTTQIDLNGDYSRDDLESTGRIPVVGRVPVRLLGPDGRPTGQRALPTDIFSALGGNVRTAINSDRGFTDRTIWGLSSRISREGDFGRLLSITALRQTDFSWLEDSTGLPSSVTDQKVNSNVNEKHSQFSQELRWISPDGGRLKHVLGFYYLYEHTHRIENFIFPRRKSTTDQDNETNSFAIFGEATYAITKKVSFTAGARMTYETKNMIQQNTTNGDRTILLEDFTLNNKGNWTDFSPNFVLSWQQSDDIMWYGSISRGYKSGGFQGAPATRELARRTINPESVWNYEIGYKSQWLDDRFRLNLVGFYSDYRDLQVVQFKTEGNFGVFQTSNAASASLKGVELEFTLKPVSGLEFFGSYAFLDATYDQFNDLSGRDFTGNVLRQAPRHSLYLAAYYERDFYKGRLRFRADYRYQGKSFREPDNSVTIQPGFDLVDASVAYESADDSWEATLWAKNLMDKEYISHLYVLGGNDYALFGTPRTYGLTITRNF
ncbi:MAG: TonB-dependent receptor [Alphaproteobacteria bacterium]|nr:TonB-dependent receptor [Alphaproteobacteria bacterium]